MLRFPLKTKLTLITTVGVICGEIIKATNDFLILNDTIINNIKFSNNVYIDRKAVIGFSEQVDKKIQKDFNNCKIIKFEEMVTNG